MNGDASNGEPAARSFDALLEATPAALLILDGAGCVSAVNRHAEALFGRTRAELVGTKIEVLINKPAGASAERIVQAVGRRPDDSAFALEAFFAPLTASARGAPLLPFAGHGRQSDADADTGAQGAQVVLVRHAVAGKEIDERNHRIDMLRTKLSQMQDTVRLRDEFLSVVSHELRTPLTPIQLQIDGALRASRRSDPDMLPTVIRKLEAIGGGIRRLSTLVNRLLDLSRITAGLYVDRSLIDLVGLAQRAVATFDDEAARSDCWIEFEAPRGEVRGLWDGARIEQVIANLVSNALRYGGNQPICVTIVEVRPGWATMFVRDQGVGIAPEHQPLVFDRFERVAQARNREGFGLGLWIVRQIVDAHTGTIKLFSRPGLGSTFAVDLPTGALPPAPLADDIVVLVATDHEVRRRFRDDVRGMGCRALAASSVDHALALMHFGVRPRLVLIGPELASNQSDDVTALGRLPELQTVPMVTLVDEAGTAPIDRLRKLLAMHCPDLVAKVPKGAASL